MSNGLKDLFFTLLSLTMMVFVLVYYLEVVEEFKSSSRLMTPARLLYSKVFGAIAPGAADPHPDLVEAESTVRLICMF